jgi:hypothetical protein
MILTVHFLKPAQKTKLAHGLLAHCASAHQAASNAWAKKNCFQRKKISMLAHSRASAPAHQAASWAWAGISLLPPGLAS